MSAKALALALVIHLLLAAGAAQAQLGGWLWVKPGGGPVACSTGTLDFTDGCNSALILLIFG